MKKKLKRTLVLTLAVLLIFTMLPLAAMASPAALGVNPTYIPIMPLSTVDIGIDGVGAVQTAINALSPDGGTVTVIGSATGFANINIPNNVTVMWNAQITANFFSTLELEGSGEFIIGSSGIIANTASSGMTILTVSPVTIRVAGGTVERNGVIAAIQVDSSGANVIVDSGIVRTTAGNPAMAINAINGTVTINGGTVEAIGLNPHAISTSTGAVVNINGGTIIGPVTGGGTINNNTAISNAATTVTAPVTGVAPNTTATGAGNFTAAVSWTPNHNPFQGGTAYTATVTLTANSGFGFPTGFTATINGQNATIGTNNGDTITFSHTFANTTHLTIGTGQFTVTNNIHTFNNSPQGATVAFSGTNATEAGTMTVSYVGTGGTVFPINTTPPTYVGTYNILVTTTGGTIYSSITDLVIGTLTINPAPIISGAITATAPVRNEAVASATATLPNTTTGAITWTHPGGAAGANFGASRVYTAEFTLTADTGFNFNGLPADTLTVAGATSVTHPAVTTGNTVTVTVVFPATAAAPGGGWTPPPQPTPVITITTQPANATVTEGDIDSNLYVTATSTQNATRSYRWYRATDADRTGASTFTGTTSATLPKPTDLTPGTHYFYVVISATGATSVRSNVAIVTVTADGSVVGFPFVDVPESHWARGYVEFAWEQDIMQGVSDTLFAPNTTLSRAMAATILWRTAGEPTATGGAVFTDVASGRWYTEAIAWANENGIVLGVGGNRFNPSANVTRQEFAAMMSRYAEFTGGSTDIPAGFDLSQFQDRNQLSDWAERYLYWANYNGLITGRTPTTLAPQGTATRAEAAGIVYRFVAAFG